ncbi:unnamed protein product, partial [Onchocerca ochengi]|uniref:Autophagy-related protein n=1 Tax=Onchocerca ochengi TaxID=42157 RepID=A0A182ERK7_ONCOC
PQSNHSTIQADAIQSANNDKNGNGSSFDDLINDQLKQLPDKLPVLLPCGVVRDAAKRLKNVNCNALAGFIIFRTDLRPVIHSELFFLYL